MDKPRSGRQAGTPNVIRGVIRPRARAARSVASYRHSSEALRALASIVTAWDCSRTDAINAALIALAKALQT